MAPKGVTKPNRGNNLERARAAAKAATIVNEIGPPVRDDGGNAPIVGITQLFSNQYSNPFRKVLSYITQTDLNNLNLVARSMRANLRSKSPPTSLRCEALRPDMLADDNTQIRGPRAPCYIVTPPTGQKSVYWCEGASFNLADPMTYRIPICGKCINEALDANQPKHWYAFSPLCHPCSVQELERHPYGTNPCTCLSPFTSPNIRAKLCFDCREVLSRRILRNYFGMMDAKLPVLQPLISASSHDGDRWRSATTITFGDPGWPPGGYTVGCRGCRCDYPTLINSYLSNPAAGPTTHLRDDHPDYEDWDDPAWVYTKGVRLMVFLCLTCDKHVDWETVMRNHWASAG